MSVDTQNKLFLGNLPFKASEQDIRNIFADFGIVDLYRPIDRESGRPKGFAFITLQDAAQVEEALKLNETMLMGRAIIVNKAISKKREPRK